MKNETGKHSWRAMGAHSPTGAMQSQPYINRIRWDDKAKMYTVIDPPKRHSKKHKN